MEDNPEYDKVHIQSVRFSMSSCRDNCIHIEIIMDMADACKMRSYSPDPDDSETSMIYMIKRIAEGLREPDEAGGPISKAALN